jgi:hypothetical protein
MEIINLGREIRALFEGKFFLNYPFSKEYFGLVDFLRGIYLNI